MTEPKLKLKAFLSLFGDWIESWLKTSPGKELLQVAYARLGDIRARIGKELKAK